MNIQTNAPDRKALAQSLGTHLGVEIAYNGPPTFAYQVGDLLVERNGSISGPDDQVEALHSHLEANGWLDREVEQVAVPVPAEGLTGTQLRNLIYSLHSKQYLLNRVLRRDAFSISDELVEAIGTAECDQADQLLAAIANTENAISGLALDGQTVTFAFPSRSEEHTRTPPRTQPSRSCSTGWSRMPRPPPASTPPSLSRRTRNTTFAAGSSGLASLEPMARRSDGPCWRG